MMMMVKWCVAFASSFGFVLTCVVGVTFGVSVGAIVLRAVGAAVVFGGIGYLFAREVLFRIIVDELTEHTKRQQESRAGESGANQRQ